MYKESVNNAQFPSVIDSNDEFLKCHEIIAQKLGGLSNKFPFVVRLQNNLFVQISKGVKKIYKA